MPTPSRPVVSRDEKSFDDAVGLGDWATATTSLARLPVPVRKLSHLTIDQLRMLQDGVIRARSVLGGVGTVLKLAIAAELQGKGVPAAKLSAGTAFGRLETTVRERADGDLVTGTRYRYKIGISFAPDTSVVDADEIAFIQTVRLVETATGSNNNFHAKSTQRQTPSATSVDRYRGQRQGWYGMKDDGTGGSALTVWKKSGPATPATMQDHAGWNRPNTTWEFESMAVCRSGTDIGTVYVVVTWGFTVDAGLELIEHARTVTNKQSTEATAAVSKWNDQAAGGAFDRNALFQMPLLALR
ncbi:MAG: hypothetical protein ACRDT0_19305 [Pseudonocardiaceae bacterium]